MSDKDYQIEYSNINERSQTPYLMDYVPDQLIKVYPYRAAKGNKNKPFIQTLTASIIRLSQDVEDYAKLKQDENGIKFIEMFAAWDDQTKVTVTSGAETFQQDIRKLRTYTALFNDFFKTDDDKPDFFTIGEPFNNAKYKAGTQRVYYGSNFQPSAQELIVDLIDQGYNVDEETRLAEITLQDVAVLEEQYNKSTLLFVLDAILFEDPQITFNNRITGQQETKPGFRVGINSYSLLNSIKAKGIVNVNNKELFTDINLYTEQAYAPIKMSPDKVTDKVTMYADWFDYTLTMPYFLANFFNDKEGNGESLKDMIVSEGYKTIESDPHIDNTSGKIKIPMGNITPSNNLQNFSVSISITSLPGVAGHEGGRSVLFTFNNIPSFDKNSQTWKIGDSDRTYFNDIYRGRGGTLHPEWNYTIDLQLTNAYLTQESNVTYLYFDIVNKSTKIRLNRINSLRYKTHTTEKLIPEEDLMLIEDLLLISAGFKDNWRNAPRTNEGKIDPTFRVGYRCNKISDIADKKPADIIDAYILQHEEYYPEFRTNEQRYRMFRSIINALSKYITSNTYTTNQGFNELNAVTLPWFLISKQKIDYWTNKCEIPAWSSSDYPFLPDGKYTTYLLQGVKNFNGKKNNSTFEMTDLKFSTYSSYFNINHTNPNDNMFKKGITIPNQLYIGSTKVLESDRKIILPELKETLAENNKINVPGQNTGTEDYLSNIFYLPIDNLNQVEQIFLSGLTSDALRKVGDYRTIPYTFTSDGIYPNKSKIIEDIYNITGYKDYIEPLKESDISIKEVVVKTEKLWNGVKDFGGGNRVDGTWFGNSDLSSFDAAKIMGISNIETTVKISDEALKRLIYLEQFKVSSEEREKIMDLRIPFENADVIHIDSNTGLNVRSYRKDYDEGFGKYWTTEWKFDGGWNVTASVIKYSVEPVTVKFIKQFEDKLKTPTLTSRQVYFDKTEWMHFINQQLASTKEMFYFNLHTENDDHIRLIDEITVLSVWGDYITLLCDGMAYELEILLPSKSDETLGVQRIIFI